MLILDDVIDLEYQEFIKETVYGSNFSWYYVSDITNPVDGFQKRPGFFHNFTYDSKVSSVHFPIVQHLIRSVEKRVQMKFTELYQARSFLQIPLSNQICDHNELDQFHVDREFNHWVILYYVNDYDGKTIISDTCYEYDRENKIDVKTHKFNIAKEVEAKQGRVLFFDGRHYHTATQVLKDVKCIINLNVA